MTDDLGWRVLHHGIPPCNAWVDAMVATPEGLVLVARSRGRRPSLATFRLEDAGWSEPAPVPLAVTRCAPLAWHDGERLALATHDGRELRVWQGGEVTAIPAVFEERHTSAVWTGERAVLVLGEWSGALGPGPRHERHDARAARMPGPLVPLGKVAVGTQLAHGGGRTIGVGGGFAVELVEDRWERIAAPPGPVVSTPAWDPDRGAFVVLLGQGPTRLHALAGASWKRVGDPLATPLKAAGLLGHDDRRRALVLVGGNDVMLSMQPTRIATLLVDEERAIGHAWDRRHGRTDSVERVGGAAVVVSHSDLTALRVAADGLEVWEPSPGSGTAAQPATTGPLAYTPDGKGRHDDRDVWITGSPHRLWFVDRLGDVWSSAGAGWEPWSSGGHPPLARRTDGALVWDGAQRRLLLVGGEQRNDTWAWEEEGAWRVLPPSELPHGSASAVATGAGVYALTAEALHRLDGDVWRLCAKLDGDFRTDLGLHHEPRRDVLIAIARSAAPGHGAMLHGSGRGGDRLVSIDAAGVHDHGELPELRGALGIDPSGDRMLCFHDNTVLAYDLARLGAVRGLPAPLPAAAARPRRAKLPKDAYRIAHRLIPTEKNATGLSRVPLPADHTLLAWLPASASLPLGPHASIAISRHDDLFARDLCDPFSDAVGVMLLDVAPPGPIVRRNRWWVIATTEAFDDPDPIRLEHLDTAPGHDLATTTKIGGFANPLHDGHERSADTLPDVSCRRCEQPLRYCIQLSADLYDIGDCGRILVYVCPAGCEGAATVESL